MIHFPKPLVAAVHGLAIGVGTTMLLHCDLVYAAERTQFSLPFVNLGLVPEAASSLLLPQLIGHQRAAELLLLGDNFDAETACQIGFVNAVCSDPLERALSASKRLAEKPSEALLATKALMKPPKESLDTQLQQEVAAFQKRVTSAEAKEAFAAFIERRRPDFSRIKAA